MAVTMAKLELIRLGGVHLSDHNRSPLAVTPERIEKRIRTANGELRKYHVADKLTFSVSWEMLPTLSEQTVDGKAGAVAVRNLYLQNTGGLSLNVRNRNGTRSTFWVMFTACNWTVVKRWKQEFWNIEISLEQV